MRRSSRFAFSLERLFEGVRNHLPPWVQVSVCTNRCISRGLVPRLYDMMRASWHQGDVNHVTGDVHFLTFLLDHRRTLLTIHDCGGLDGARGVKRWIIWLVWYRLPVRWCALVSVVSEATRERVLASTGADPSKIRVVHNFISEEFEASPKAFDSRCPRILHVGTKTNKNIERHAAALEGIECRLVVIGELSDAQRAVLSTHRIYYETHVDLSRSAVLDQYRECDLLLFASTYEGFGLPIIEAQAVGRPVITSNCSAMPEVAGDAACLVDPLSIDSIRAGVQRILADAPYRTELIARGFENIERFRVGAIAERYAALYREIREDVVRG